MYSTQARTIEKRLLVTRPESRDVTRLTRELEEALDCSVPFSSLARAVLRLVVHHRVAILDVAREHRGELSVPQRGDEPALLEFEEELTEIVARAVAGAWEKEE